MSTLRLMAQSISHPTTDLTIEILQRSTGTSLLTTVKTVYEWITTIDVDMTISPQILATKDIEIRMTPNHVDPNVHLYQMILSTTKIWRLSSTISDDLGITEDGFLPSKVVMTATAAFEFNVTGALNRPRAMLFASLKDELQPSLNALSLREIPLAATADDEVVLGVQGMTK